MPAVEREVWDMRQSRKSLAGLAAAVLLFAACSTSVSSPAPLATSNQTAAPSATVAASPTPSAAVALPPAPTNFTVKQRQGTVPCPSPADASCSQTDLAWQSNADASTWFRIYDAGTGEGPIACTDVKGQAVVELETKPGARSAQLFAELATGGGETCLWITAVNSAGESARVAAAGQTSTAPPLPPVPTNFTAKLHQGAVPCPSPNGDANCSQTDLAWQSNADASTWFMIYEASTGEGPTTCGDVQGDAVVALETKPGARSAQLFAEIATGGGETCLWITAVNDGGESVQVPAAGQ
jgi:hypothetical protein